MIYCTRDEHANDYATDAVAQLRTSYNEECTFYKDVYTEYRFGFRFMVFNAIFNKYFIYIVAVNFIGGENNQLPQVSDKLIT